MRFPLIIALILYLAWPVDAGFTQQKSTERDFQGKNVSISVDMRKIAYIESSGCKNLVGDNGKALGCYQLHSGVVAEYNQYRKASLKHSDVMNRETGLIVASWYMNKRIPAMLRHYKQPDTLENRLTAYNMGIGAVIKGKRASKYIDKYNKQSVERIK